ncbi:MAG TPA: UbiA family prenyltransferase, partial [Spirochaetia bacterium]|nr:UbiA family prenyltransferase [Spirochaetia bacterium]
PHALLDLAAPAVTALLWAGQIPEIRTIVLGLVTSFAAYTAVYALNDLVDCRRDARRAAGCPDPDVDLDAAMQLHPVAQGCLSFRAGLSWTLFWGVVASVGSYLLNPVCLFMFLAACLFETLYCALGGVTPFRAILAGVVKSAGPLAAIIAVDPTPSTGRFILFLAWLFLWEIGGQNIPNDLADVAEDSRLGFRTVPVSIGPGSVAAVTFAALVATVLLSLSLAPVAGTMGSILFALLTALIGVGLLLFPGYRLFASADRRNALYLFNRASYYPLSLLVLTTARITLRL